MYNACIRSVLLYGTETWSITRRQEQFLAGCDRRMLRYMAGVRWTDRVRSGVVATWCGLDHLEEVIRERRLRWYGHVRRREEGDNLGDILRMEVPGARPRGRPKKTWMENVREDMGALGLREEDLLDRERWRALIRRRTP